MSPFRRCSAVLLAVALVSAPGCMSTPVYEGPGEHVTEKSWVTTRLKATLIENPQVKATEVN